MKAIETPTKTKTELLDYAAAGYPAVAIATADEDRAIARILADFPSRPCYRVAAVRGLLDLRTGRPLDATTDYPGAFGHAAKRAAIVVVCDYQHTIRNPVAYRQLRDALAAVKAQKGSMLILLAPSWSLPPEVEHDIPVISDSLPDRDELGRALDLCVAATGTDIDVAARPALLDAASGLTLAEAENSIALSFAATGEFIPARVTEEKLKLVRQSGYLEIATPADIATLGGLGELKRAVAEEIAPNIHDTELAVSGAIFCGVPGTGKTHAARVIASILQWPCLKASVARLKGGTVGASEGNTLALFRVARAVAPCVLMFDELEKGVGGHASSAVSDSGATLGMVEIILTQMQEIRDAGESVLFVATCNDYSKLPAELTRRFELRFFVDLPTPAEREEIARIKLARYSPGAERLAADVVTMTEDWTGAEIEDLVRAAARTTRRKVTTAALTAAAADIKPIARVRADEISRLRTWGRDNLRLANSVTVAASPKPARSVAVRKTDHDVIDSLMSGAMSADRKGGTA